MLYRLSMLRSVMESASDRSHTFFTASRRGEDTVVARFGRLIDKGDVCSYSERGRLVPEAKFRLRPKSFSWSTCGTGVHTVRASPSASLCSWRPPDEVRNFIRLADNIVKHAFTKLSRPTRLRHSVGLRRLMVLRERRGVCRPFISDSLFPSGRALPH